MIVFEVTLNGNQIARAGRQDLCVLNTIVNAVGVLGEESAGSRGMEDGFNLDLTIGGLSAKSNEDPGQHLRWAPRQAVKIGDEIIVRILQTDNADNAVSTKEREAVDHAAIERRNWELAREHYLKFKDKYEVRDA
ncbi:MAG: hypothetical protein RJQ07_05910 [Pseudomonadales bacterium]